MLKQVLLLSCCVFVAVSGCICLSPPGCCGGKCCKDYAEYRNFHSLSAIPEVNIVQADAVPSIIVKDETVAIASETPLQVEAKESSALLNCPSDRHNICCDCMGRNCVCCDEEKAKAQLSLCPIWAEWNTKAKTPVEVHQRSRIVKDVHPTLQQDAVHASEREGAISLLDCSGHHVCCDCYDHCECCDGEQAKAQPTQLCPIWMSWNAEVGKPVGEETSAWAKTGYVGLLSLWQIILFSAYVHFWRFMNTYKYLSEIRKNTHKCDCSAKS